MKNCLIAILSTVLLASISTAAWSAKPLDIITPNGGEELVKGKKYVIEWNKSGYGKNLKSIAYVLEEDDDKPKLQKYTMFIDSDLHIK